MSSSSNRTESHHARTRIIKVPVFTQRTERECGTTTLKSVLWYHGKRTAARDMARLCRLTNDGTDHGGLVEGALRLGASVFEKDRGTIDELRSFLDAGLPCIVGWWSMDEQDSHFNPKWTLAERRKKDCGHYSTCCGLSSQRIWLMDPQWRRDGSRWKPVGMRSLPLRDFLPVWYDTDTPNYHRVRSWYMVVHFDDEAFAPRLGGGIDHSPN